MYPASYIKTSLCEFLLIIKEVRYECLSVYMQISHLLWEHWYWLVIVILYVMMRPIWYEIGRLWVRKPWNIDAAMLYARHQQHLQAGEWMNRDIWMLCYLQYCNVEVWQAVFGNVCFGCQICQFSMIQCILSVWKQHNISIVINDWKMVRKMGKLIPWKFDSQREILKLGRKLYLLLCKIK